MQSATKAIGKLSPIEIRELVRAKYSEVALDPQSKYKFRVGRQYALDLGYPIQEIDSVPEVLADSFTGVSSYLAHCDEFAPGDFILELGSGGGARHRLPYPQGRANWKGHRHRPISGDGP